MAPAASLAFMICSESPKKRVTVLIDVELAAHLRELISVTATRHTMSSAAAKAMVGAPRFLGRSPGHYWRWQCHTDEGGSIQVAVAESVTFGARPG